jgi:hypothetical protein
MVLLYDDGGETFPWALNAVSQLFFRSRSRFGIPRGVGFASGAGEVASWICVKGNGNTLVVDCIPVQDVSLAAERCGHLLNRTGEFLPASVFGPSRGFGHC